MPADIVRDRYPKGGRPSEFAAAPATAAAAATSLSVVPRTGTSCPPSFAMPLPRPHLSSISFHAPAPVSIGVRVAKVATLASAAAGTAIVRFSVPPGASSRADVEPGTAGYFSG